MSAFKSGGTLNSLQGFVLWLPPAAVIVVASCSSMRGAAVARSCLAIAAIAGFSGRIIASPVQAWRPFDVAYPYEDACEISRLLPMQVWFPCNPLVTVFTEGRLYHVEDGLHVRALIGRPVTVSAGRSQLPPRFSAFVTLSHGSTWGIAEKVLHGPLEKIDFGVWTLSRRRNATSTERGIDTP
jgi:hypothetical protein